MHLAPGVAKMRHSFQLSVDLECLGGLKPGLEEAKGMKSMAQEPHR